MAALSFTLTDSRRAFMDRSIHRMFGVIIGAAMYLETVLKKFVVKQYYQDRIHNTLRYLGDYLLLPLVYIAARYGIRRHTHYIWTCDPLHANAYWSRAMRGVGYQTQTLMSGHYFNLRREDFDLYFEDLLTDKIKTDPNYIAWLGPYYAMLHLLANARVVNIPCNSGPFGFTRFWRHTPRLFKLARIKTIVSSYGSDAWMYSDMPDLSFTQGMLVNYPEAGRNEHRIREQVQMWVKHADAFITGHMVDGVSRWDICVPNVTGIDTDEYPVRSSISQADGIREAVKIVHAPNHRGPKGTEFLLDAVQRLQNEGLKIELVLLEGVTNREVREKLLASDILVEQLLFGYGQNAMEGMAASAVVVSNLEHERYRTLFRRFSYMEECPIVSATPESLTDDLRVLVTTPRLRTQLALAGRAFAEKYHSLSTVQFIFTSIFAKIELGLPVDLMQLFHPKYSVWNNKTPKIEVPLEIGRIPEKLVSDAKAKYKKVTKNAPTATQEEFDYISSGISKLVEKKQTGKALAKLGCATAAYPQDWRFWFLYGMVLNIDRQFPIAFVALQRARSLHPTQEIEQEMEVLKHAWSKYSAVHTALHNHL